MPALTTYSSFSATTLAAALSTSTPSSFRPISIAAITNTISDHITVSSIPTSQPTNIALPNTSHPQVNATALVALYLDKDDIIIPREGSEEGNKFKVPSLPGRFDSRKGATGVTRLPNTGYMPHSECGADCAIGLERHSDGSVRQKCICGPDLEKLENSRKGS